MIIKKINVEGIQYDSFEVQVLLEDGSVRGELFNEENPESRERSVVFCEPWPFELTEEELLELNPNQNEPLI